MDYNSGDLVRKVYEQDGLLDILASFEKYLDDMDLYVYEGWIDGVVVEGPNVSKYWVEVTLMYDGDKMPDPRGTKIFTSHGVKIMVKKTFQPRAIEKPRSSDDMHSPAAGTLKPKVIDVPVILYKFIVPRQLLDFSSFDEYKILDAQDSEIAYDNPALDETPDDSTDDNAPDQNFDSLMGGNDDNNAGE